MISQLVLDSSRTPVFIGSFKCSPNFSVLLGLFIHHVCTIIGNITVFLFNMHIARYMCVRAHGNGENVFTSSVGRECAEVAAGWRGRRSLSNNCDLLLLKMRPCAVVRRRYSVHMRAI